MDDPVAIITGGGRGIGRATAIELHGRGFRLVLVARTRDALVETDKLAGGGAVIVPADVRDPASAESATTHAVERFGRIDALVHAAGIAPMHDVESTTPQIWRDVIDVNLSAAFYFARAVWPHLKRRPVGGAIVNVSSYSARDPFPRFAAYGSAKAGLNLLGLSLAREGAPLGVRVYTVAPAAVETPMFRGLMSVEQIPAERVLSPQDVARVIAQCIVGDLRYTSGEVIWLNKTIA